MRSQLRSVLSGCLSILLVFSLLSASPLMGEVNTDSLEKVAASGKPEERFKAYKALSKYYQRRDPGKSLQMAEKQRSIADAMNNPGLYAEAIADLSVPHALMYQNKEAIMLLQESVRIFDSLKDERGKAMAMNNLGICWAQQGSVEKALDHYIKVADYYMRKGEQKSLARVYLNMGLAYEDNKKYDLAIEVTRKARDIFKTCEDYEMVSSALVNLGLYFTATGKFNEARLFLDQAWQFYEKTGNTYGKAITLTNIGRLHQKQGENRQATEIFLQALPLVREVNNHWAEAGIYYDLADMRLTEKKYAEVISYLNQALALNATEPDANLESKIYLALAKVFSRLGNKDTANAFFQKYINIRDTIFSREKARIVEELTISYETSKKETENRLLKEQIRLAVMKQWLIAGLAAVLLLVAFLVIRMQAMKHKQAEITAAEEKQRQEVEMQRINNEKYLNEEALDRMALEIQIKEKELVYQTLLRLDMKHVNQNIQDKLTPFRFRLTNKKDQQEFAKALQEISREAEQEPMADFEVLFKQLHKGFEEKLLSINPGLSRSELTVCALLRINLTSKDIARLLNLSVSSVDMIRYRIRQKLELEQGENLTRYLMAL
ncbi:MAG TPA: tetratricopeptide repeat protein [Bacteroidales bacterium]|nr:tetratricopeptide repeat protein [Bacteroidales bacterium]HSA42584.1 tetratricopeptide repeat protein [Bacteroidales bacterium]